MIDAADGSDHKQFAAHDSCHLQRVKHEVCGSPRVIEGQSAVEVGAGGGGEAGSIRWKA